jgi:membrane-bound serine protease (ClpP class)
LRPSGTALIDGKRIDVVTEGIYLLQDSVIKVTAVKGPRVVVTEVKK